MTDLLKEVPVWFLVIAVVLLGGWFLWSANNIFTGIKGTLEKLDELIGKLFDKHGNHETRISAIEGRCNAMHGETPHQGGRRNYDPEERNVPHL